MSTSSDETPLGTPPLQISTFWPFSNATVAPVLAKPGPLVDPIATEPLYPKCITNYLGAMGIGAKRPPPTQTVRNFTIVLCHGGGHLARALPGSTVIAVDSELAAFENERPLATVYSQRRAFNDGSFDRLSHDHPIGDGIWQAGYPDLAKFPSGSATRIVIEQAHRDVNLEHSVRELSRVGVRGAHFLLIGYQMFHVPAAPRLTEWISSRWNTGLSKVMTKGERHLDAAFRNLVIPRSSEAFRGTGYVRGPQYLSKKLSLVELITTHLDLWPVVQRLDRAPSSAWFDTMKLRKEISDLWDGNPRTRKEVRWMPVCRWGVIE